MREEGGWAGGGGMGGGRQEDEGNYVSKHNIIYRVYVLCICYGVSNSALFNPLYVEILFLNASNYSCFAFVLSIF